MQETAAQFNGQPVDFYTVSLDEERVAFAATVKEAGLTWPTQCDGLGWKSEWVRALGVNALPTLWVLDKRGVLVTLNALEGNFGIHVEDYGQVGGVAIERQNFQGID